ncbi:MAG: methyltransferase [Chitinophagales bacterium]|nr:methyltransferase [Chitinophagales bacterium]
MALAAFQFKKFEVAQQGAAHPVGTDAVLLGAWADVAGVSRFLDIGTGTGVVALMAAQRLAANTAHWEGYGVDIHPASIALARQNFEKSAWAAHLKGVESPVQQLKGPLPASFDLILSNPPFFSETTTSPDKTRSLGRHTASLTPQELLTAALTWLHPQGRFCVVLPAQEGYRLCELAVPMGLYWTKIVEVHSKPEKPLERLLIQLESTPYPISRERVCLQEGAQRSEWFRNLTADFYLAG